MGQNEEIDACLPQYQREGVAVKSLATKIEQIDGLRGTKDISAWEDSFIASIIERVTENAQTIKDTRGLTSKQVEIVERIFEKHFA